MSGIHGIGSNNPVQKIVSQPIHKSVPAQAAKQAKLTDKAQLANVSHLVAAMKAGADVRVEKVAIIRQQLDAGTYETEAKLDQAINRLLDDLSR